MRQMMDLGRLLGLMPGPSGDDFAPMAPVTATYRPATPESLNPPKPPEGRRNWSKLRFGSDKGNYRR
jgi:hypothetical protein